MGIRSNDFTHFEFYVTTGFLYIGEGISSKKLIPACLFSYIFWVLFTNGFGGFSWLYLVYLKLSSPLQGQLQLLILTADKTYNGTTYGILGLWYIAGTVSFVVLMTAIFLLTKKEISASKYVILFSITIAMLYLTHIVEAVVFGSFIAFYGDCFKNCKY